jgi:hypothetical protein
MFKVIAARCAMVAARCQDHPVRVSPGVLASAVRNEIGTWMRGTPSPSARWAPTTVRTGLVSQVRRPRRILSTGTPRSVDAPISPLAASDRVRQQNTRATKAAGAAD